MISNQDQRTSQITRSLLNSNASRGERAIKGQILRSASGLQYISRKLACIEDAHDLWIAYEVGDTTLSELLCTVTRADDDGNSPPAFLMRKPGKTLKPAIMPDRAPNYSI